MLDNCLIAGFAEAGVKTCRDMYDLGVCKIVFPWKEQRKNKKDYH